MSTPTLEEIDLILDELRTALAARATAAGASRIKVGDLEIEFDVREITRLIDYYENLRAKYFNRTTIVKGLDLGNAY